MDVDSADRFGRARKVLFNEYGVSADGDLFDAIASVVAPSEMRHVRACAHPASFAETSEVLGVVEKEFRSPIAVCLLQNDKVFLNLMKRHGDAYPATLEIHRRLLEKYPFESATQKKADQGILDVGITGHVRVRFPPEPSGYLHIGHAKAALLNNYYATVNNGELIVRFDDTNPAKESAEFEEAILADLKTLGVTKFSLSHTSDYFDEMISLCRELIGRGRAYCDDTEKDEMRRERDVGTESRRRNAAPSDSAAIFDEMVAGGKKEFCVRAKIDMQNNNKALRDPVIFRCSADAHYRVGTRYKIYPTYDFACPVVDSLEKVTHTLRTNEYRDRNPQFFWFIENLGLKSAPQIIDYARMSFEDTCMSKRKLRQIVDNNAVAWDDPRMPTIRGIVRRGLRMDTLREYVLMQGFSQKIATIAWDKLWALNKRKIESDAPRYFCVRRSGCVATTVFGHAGVLGDVAKSAKNAAIGTKSVLFASEILVDQADARLLRVGDEFRLMQWANAVVRSKTESAGAVAHLEIEINEKGDVKSTQHRIAWVAVPGSVAVKLVEFGNLLASAADGADPVFNAHSRTADDYVAENAVAKVAVGEIVQFERIGFFYADERFEFNLVPFTKQQRKKA